MKVRDYRFSETTKMIKNLNKFRFTFSPKALLFGCPNRSLLRDIRVLFSLGFFSSKSYCLCLPVILSKKEKNYINFKNFTNTKLNCLTVLECKTTKTYYLIIKEPICSIFNILSLLKRNPLNINI